MMTKTLIILRHGKAEFSSTDGQDISRQLAERGHKEARMMGKLLRKTDVIPQRILLSPSVRTRETTDSVLKKLRSTPEIVVDDGIYNASVGELVQIIGKQLDATSILLIGHNPGLEELVARLINPADPPLIQLPTCGMARIEFEIEEWNDIVEHAGRLVWLTTPQLLEAM